MASRSNRTSTGIGKRLADLKPSGLHASTEAELKQAAYRPTGEEIFADLSPEKQDEVLGPEAAAMVRNGDAVLADFVHVDGGFIRQKPPAMVREAKAFREEDHPRGGGGRFRDAPDKPKKPKVPQWKRDQKYNGWVRSLSLAEQEVLARKFYAELWSEIEGYFGDMGAMPPNLVFVDSLPSGYPAAVWKDEKGIRQLQVVRSQVLQMVLRGGEHQARAAAWIAHEWRHIFQNAALYWIGRDQPHDQQPMEVDANNFGVEMLRVMNQNRKRRRRRKPLIRPYVYNPQNISENIGVNPTTIAYPSTPP